jgi:hypothetical protein
LEPDIVAAIVIGRQPAEITPAVLMWPFPPGWREQRISILELKLSRRRKKELRVQHTPHADCLRAMQSASFATTKRAKCLCGWSIIPPVR